MFKIPENHKIKSGWQVFKGNVHYVIHFYNSKDKNYASICMFVSYVRNRYRLLGFLYFGNNFNSIINFKESSFKNYQKYLEELEEHEKLFEEFLIN